MKVIKNSWVFEFTPRAQAAFKKLDYEVKRRIKKLIDSMIPSEVNPQQHWKQLTGTLYHLYSARIGDYRILAEIKKNEFKILAVSVGHRKEVYKT